MTPPRPTDHGGPAGDPLAAVAGLAREVEALRRLVDGRGGLRVKVDDLATTVAQIAAQLANVAGAASPPIGGSAVSWLDLHVDPNANHAMAGPAEDDLAAQVLDDLLGWLRRVYLRYPDAANGLPACWLWHPEIVEELCWLRAAWLAAYVDNDARVSLAGDWHDRQRPGVVRRIRDYAGVCSIESHQPGGERHQPATEPPLADAAGTLSRWWARHRRDIPPSPTEDQAAEAGRWRPRNQRGRGRT